jgi:hypothetical protein
MTITNQLAAATEYAALWQAMTPGAEIPPMSQFIVWAGQHKERPVVRGITRAVAKARAMQSAGTPMTVDDAARYASSVMRHESLGERKLTPNLIGCGGAKPHFATRTTGPAPE